jgi:murein DD-endopeptidase MepM/ murein hydrolase activator NlpD
VDLPQVPEIERTTEVSNVDTRRPEDRTARAAFPRVRRFAALLGAVTVVAVIGSACGQFPNVHRDPVAAQTPVSVSSPVPETETPADPATVRSEDPTPGDGAEGPGKHAVTGGAHSVALSTIFAVKGDKQGSGSGQQNSGTGRQGSGQRSSGRQNTGGNDGGSTTDAKGDSRSGSKQTGKGDSGSKPDIAGDDGADPGKPDIEGEVGPGTSTGASLDLAELISRETVQGAIYNGTVLPAGFPFWICPVQGQYSYSDGYGAPRYAGGYHPHAGVDIFADQGTPVVAPFDGYVERVPNTLGGNAVKVHGAQGYVYMAHLVAYGITDREVKKGTVVGFVGNTGDAQGTAYHDHFEWHPNSIASYDRVIAGTNDAVDPFPYLQVVCPPD